MEFFRIHKTIPFMRHALVLNIVSFATFALAVFFLFHRGLHLSVEFTGGTVMEVAYKQSADIGKVRDAIGKLGYPDVQVQSYGSSENIQIRLPAQKGMSSDQQSAQVMQALKSVDESATQRGIEVVGPQVGEELTTNGLKALGMVVVGIMIYLAFRFSGSSRWRPCWPTCTTW